MRPWLSFGCALFMLPALSQTPNVDSHWELVWSDDFDYFNEDRWYKSNNTFHSEEPQLYIDDNVGVENGKLEILTSLAPYVCPSALDIADAAASTRACVPGQVYQLTSGMVQTTEMFNITYGYMEMRAKMPHKYGLWPAFWTYIGQGVVDAPNQNEIDIFELYGCGESTVGGTNVHLVYDNHSTETNEALNFPSNIEIPDYSLAYHDYAIAWDSEKIIWFVDGMIMRVLPNHQVQRPARLIINVAIALDTCDWQSPLADQWSPAVGLYSFIDHVRLYKLKYSCDEFIDAMNYEIGEHSNEVHNFIRLQGGGSIGPTSGDVFLRASNFIELGPDLTIQDGTSIYAEASAGCTEDLSAYCTTTFNPCDYVIDSNYSGSKRIIELGGDACAVTVSATNSLVDLTASRYIRCEPGVTINSETSGAAVLRIESCTD